MNSQKAGSCQGKGLGWGRNPGIVTGETLELIDPKFTLVSNQRKCPLDAWFVASYLRLKMTSLCLIIRDLMSGSKEHPSPGRRGDSVALPGDAKPMVTVHEITQGKTLIFTAEQWRISFRKMNVNVKECVWASELLFSSSSFYFKWGALLRWRAFCTDLKVKKGVFCAGTLLSE